jgi:outer membrane beta-barrel protein
MKPAWKLSCLLLVLALLAPVAASADEAQEAGRLVAIQQRKFRLAHELELGGMFEPLDAFTKGVALEGSYTLHLDDAWSWEVLRGGYVARLDTGLHAQLLNEFGVEPTKFESLQYYVSSNILYAPLYGKFALRNASVVHVEAFLVAGGALGRFSSVYAAAPELGVGVRVFLSRALSVRFDARDAYFLGRRLDQNNKLFLSLGLSLNLGGNE